MPIINSMKKIYLNNSVKNLTLNFNLLYDNDLLNNYL